MGTQSQVDYRHFGRLVAIAPDGKEGCIFPITSRLQRWSWGSHSTDEIRLKNKSFPPQFATVEVDSLGNVYLKKRSADVEIILSRGSKKASLPLDGVVLLRSSDLINVSGGLTMRWDKLLDLSLDFDFDSASSSLPTAPVPADLPPRKLGQNTSSVSPGSTSFTPDAPTLPLPSPAPKKRGRKPKASTPAPARPPVSSVLAKKSKAPSLPSEISLAPSLPTPTPTPKAKNSKKEPSASLPPHPPPPTPKAKKAKNILPPATPSTPKQKVAKKTSPTSPRPLIPSSASLVATSPRSKECEDHRWISKQLEHNPHLALALPPRRSGSVIGSPKKPEKKTGRKGAAPTRRKKEEEEKTEETEAKEEEKKKKTPTPKVKKEPKVKEGVVEVEETEEMDPATLSEKLTECWRTMYDSNDGEPFRVVVDKKAFPDYREVVSNPIALSMIKTRLNKYTSVQDFLKDIQLMVDNCHLYCEKKYPKVTLMADALMSLCLKTLKELGLQVIENKTK